MKYIKTYGISGLLEWHGFINNNGVSMQLHFTNGSMTAHGVAPATFTSKNEITQHFIENSDQFKNGRIRLVRSVPIPGTENDDNHVEKHVKPVKTVQSDGTEGRPEEDENAVDGVEGVAVKKTQVKVSSVEDAKDYLVDKFGIAGSKLRTRAACIAAGEENGIEFIWE